MTAFPLLWSLDKYDMPPLGSLHFSLLVTRGSRPVASQNCKASFGSSLAPSKIDVYPKSIETRVLKAPFTRYAVDIEEPDLQDGSPRHNVTTVPDDWVDHYN